MLAGPIFWPIEEHRKSYGSIAMIAEAPDELTTILAHRGAATSVPARGLHGKPIVGAALLCGGAGGGAEVIQPLKEFGSPVLDLCVPKPFLTHQAMFDPSFPHGWWYYLRACDVEELTDEVIDFTVDHALRINSPLSTFVIWQLGGAVARVGEEENSLRRTQRRA